MVLPSNKSKKGRIRRSAPSNKAQAENRLCWTNQRLPLALPIAVFVLHLVGLAFLFVPAQGIFDNQPIIEQDWGLHFHHLRSIAAFWQQDRMLWGYNPFFMAGYPSNTIQDLSIKLFELSALALAMVALTPLQWFKVLTFLAVAFVPWLLYFAARNLFFARQEIKNLAAVTAGLLGTIYWWNSFPREMFFYGMVGYAPASYVSVLGVSLLYRIGRQSSWWSPAHAGWLLIALLIPALHIQSVLVLLPAALALLVVETNFARRKLLLWIAGAGAISLLLNLPWLLPAFDHRRDDVSAIIVDQLPLFTSVDPLTFVKDYLGPHGYSSFRPLVLEKGFRIVLLLLGLLGTLRLLRGEYRDLGVTLAAPLLTLFLVAYFGSLIPFLRGWQPLRFKVPYDLFLALAASYAVARWANNRLSASPRYLVPILSACGLVTFLLNLASTESTGAFRIRTRMNPEFMEIVSWIGKEAPAEGRILFEESGEETGFIYGGMYLSSFVPHGTDRQLIGGPINLYNDRHHFAEFHSGKLFKREIQTLGDEEIKNYFRLYNIGAVVAFHPASVKRLQSVPGLVVLDRRIGPVHLMKVNQPLTWFVRGEGKVTASSNRIEVSGAKSEEMILKYHWVEGLAGTAALKIVPVTIDDDPIPFIKIINPPARFVLRVAP